MSSLAHMIATGPKLVAQAPVMNQGQRRRQSCVARLREGFKELGPCTVAQLTRHLGYSLQGLNRIINDLIAEGRIVRAGSVRATNGRDARILQWVENETGTGDEIHAQN